MSTTSTKTSTTISASTTYADMLTDLTTLQAMVRLNNPGAMQSLAMFAAPYLYRNALRNARRYGEILDGRGNEGTAQLLADLQQALFVMVMENAPYKPTARNKRGSTACTNPVLEMSADDLYRLLCQRGHATLQRLQRLYGAPRTKADESDRRASDATRRESAERMYLEGDWSDEATDDTAAMQAIPTVDSYNDLSSSALLETALQTVRNRIGAGARTALQQLREGHAPNGTSREKLIKAMAWAVERYDLTADDARYILRHVG